MGSIGLIIKQERIKQNIKQSNLAQGICSESYLSKIENNSTQPSEEILQLLLQRLNISLTEMSEDDESKFLQSLYSFYKEAVLSRNKDLVKELIQQDNHDPKHFSVISNYHCYNLYLFRFNLILEKPIVELKPMVDLLESFQKTISGREQFLLYQNLGLYYFLNMNYPKSLCYMEKCQSVLEKISIEEWELADFHNALSLSYLLNNEVSNALYYASLSLKYYKDHLYLNRAIDCYIILGNIHKRLNDFNKTESNYLLALKIAADLEMVEYEGMIFQNLGSLFSSKGDTEKAINYYHLSLDRKKKKSLNYFLTILSLIKEYSKQEDSQNVISWCERGLEALTLHKMDHMSKSYEVHFTLYQAIHSSAENLADVLKKSIKFFEQNGDLRHAQKYSLVLAEYYHRNNKYKAALDYYQKFTSNLFKQKHIEHWEDL